MDGTQQDIKARNKEIAANEAERQVAGDIRVSAWAIAMAVLLVFVGLGIGWLILRR
ncbi:MAG: hypothetical protein KDJ76_03105 [Xanthobacteraceae bacterium]|nr:hypothetical protein [Xanthobacteraceae bacterium]